MGFNIGILTGLGERYRADKEEKRKQSQNLLSNAAQFWQTAAQNAREEAQPELLRRAFAAMTHDPSKAPPKELLDASILFEGVKPEVGKSWLGGETQREVTAQPMPIRSSLDDQTAVRPLQAEHYAVPVPEPTPQTRVPVYPTRREKELEGQRARTFQTDEMIRQQRALQQAEREFAVPTPRNIDPNSQEGILAQVQQEKLLKELGLGRYADAATQKSLQESEVTLKGGGRTMAFFNPDPNNPGYFKKDSAGRLVDITEQVEGQYRQPPQISASLQMANVTQPAAGMPPDVSNALSRASMKMSPQRRLQVYTTVNQHFNQGDAKGVRDTIKQAALESESDRIQAQVQGRREVIKALVDIQDLLKGVPTNLLAGTVEDTVRKLGTTTDPRYVRISTRLRTLNQAYRRSMTGAQFSIPEAQEYASIFPSYSNTAPVNTEQIGALIEAFGANDSIYWDNKLGPGWSDVPTITAPSGGSNPSNLKSLSTEELFRRLTTQ